MAQVRRSSQGFSYLIVLFAVAALGAGLAAAGIVWEKAGAREKEIELLFAGNAYRNAIASYYERTPGGVKTFPRSLEDLLKDPRLPVTVRHLRRMYKDPITNSLDWGLIQAPGGGIMGVYSKSEAHPVKMADFYVPNVGFEELAIQLKEKMTYQNWQFAYPAGAPAAPQPSATAPSQPAPGTPTPNPPGAGAGTPGK